MGDKPRAGVKPIDSDKLRAAMASLVEEQKANDPAELKKRIHELERQVKNQKPVQLPPKVETKIVHVAPKMTKEIMDEIRVIIESRFLAHVASLNICREATPPYPKPVLPTKAAIIASVRHGADPDAGLAQMSKCERALLTVLAQFLDRDEGCSKNKLALLSGYSVSSSGFQNALSRLRVTGAAFGSDPVRCTELGRSTIGEVPEMLTGAEAVDYWTRNLGKCPAAVLGAVAKLQGRSIPEIARFAGYSETSSGFQNALSELRVRGLIVTSGRGPEAVASLHPDTK